MKKIISLTILIIVALSTFELKEASANHLGYQNMNIYGGKLLKDYTDEELEEHFKEVDKRKFSGWNIDYIANGALTHYRAKTVLSYHNTGSTAIDYKYTYTQTTSQKMSFSASGTIKLEGSAGNKGAFKGGLDASLKLEYDKDSSVVEKEEISLSFKCDPQTKVILYIAGEGYLYNGVAKKYIFWFENQSGGFEYFITSTEYQVLEKIEL